MRRSYRLTELALLLFLAAPGGLLGAATPSPYHDVLSPAPPGTIVQDQAFHPYGPGTEARWHAVLSKKLLGTQAGMPSYQWYLTFYGMGERAFRLAYQSPHDGGPFVTSAKAAADDAHFWLPVQSGSIAGIAHLMGTDADQLVLVTHAERSDCGTSTVTVYAYDQKTSTVRPAASVSNTCSLQASVSAGSVRVSGPVRGMTRTATLSYGHGAWHVSGYFPLHTVASPAK